MMTTKELIKAKQNNQPVYYMGDCYDTMNCKGITGSNVAIVQHSSLSNCYSPVEIKPMLFKLGGESCLSES